MEVASPSGQRRTTLSLAIEYLKSHAREVALFQAMRMVLWAEPRGAGAKTRRRVRIRHLPHLHHPNADLDEVREIDDRLDLHSHVLGLLSPSGPLPLRLVEEAVWQTRQDRASPLGDFLSMLGERHLHWFYEAWCLGRTEEIAHVGAGEATQRRAATALSGASLGSRRHFGLLAQLMNAPRSPSALSGLLAAITGCQVRITQFVGEWLAIQAEDRVQLGSGRLGENLSIGSRVWQRVSLFDVHLKVGSFHEYVELIPGRGVMAAQVEHYVSLFIRGGLRWRYQLELPASEAQPARLGYCGDLGQTCWLGCPTTRHATVRFASAMIRMRQPKGAKA